MISVWFFKSDTPNHQNDSRLYRLGFFVLGISFDIFFTNRPIYFE